jgi:hypothetical protein
MTDIENEMLDAIPSPLLDEREAASACYEIHKREIKEVLMKICAEISRKGIQAFNDNGSESYSERSGLHDAKSIVYSYTEKYRIECEKIEIIRSKG